mgnify:FL=1
MDDQIWGYKKESGLPELPEVGKLQVKNAAWPMPMESHPDAVEFLLLRSGCKQIQVEDRLYEMQGGDLLVVFPGERHGAEDFVQNRTSLAYLLMAVPTEVPRFCMLEEEERSALWEQLKLLKGRMLKVSPSVCRTMDRLFDHVNTGLPLERARIRTELMRFLFQILEEAGEEDKSLPADIAAVIRYIREAREEMPDIAKMAALVNLSESRFKQKFKQATGIPPAEFTVREKIRESQTLLKDPARTVTSIAMELGFSSSQHFSVLFRKYTGLSPIQYRQNHEFVS